MPSAAQNLRSELEGGVEGCGENSWSGGKFSCCGLLFHTSSTARDLHFEWDLSLLNVIISIVIEMPLLEEAVSHFHYYLLKS